MYLNWVASALSHLLNDLTLIYKIYRSERGGTRLITLLYLGRDGLFGARSLKKSCVMYLLRKMLFMYLDKKNVINNKKKVAKR